MQGRRLYSPKYQDCEAGDYWLNELRTPPVWELRSPNGHLGSLGNHDVVEHEDGTITVSPSILISNPQQGELYHGFLEKGIWRDA